jgi:hypothetical protein
MSSTRGSSTKHARPFDARVAQLTGEHDAVVLRCWKVARQRSFRGYASRAVAVTEKVLLAAVRAVAARPNSHAADETTLKRALLDECKARAAALTSPPSRRRGPAEAQGPETRDRERPDAPRPGGRRPAGPANGAARVVDAPAGVAKTPANVAAGDEAEELASTRLLRALRGNAPSAAPLRPRELSAGRPVLEALGRELGPDVRPIFFAVCDAGYPPAGDLLEAICVAIQNSYSDVVAKLTSQVPQFLEKHLGATPMLDDLSRGEGTPWSPAAVPETPKVPPMGFQPELGREEPRKSVPRRRLPRDAVAEALGGYTRFARWVYYERLFADARNSAEAFFRDLRALCPGKKDVRAVASKIRGWAARGRKNVKLLSPVARRVLVRAVAIAAALPERFVREPPLHGPWGGLGPRRCSWAVPEVLCVSVSATAALRFAGLERHGQFGETLVANVSLLVGPPNIPARADVLDDRYVDIAYSKRGPKDAAAQFVGDIFDRSIGSVREPKPRRARPDSISIPRELLELRYVERLALMAFREMVDRPPGPMAGIGSCISELAPQSH